jgi:hypothetical protein
MNIVAYMLSCPEREAIRAQTIANLAATDWPSAPVVELDQSAAGRRQERQEQTALRMLQRAIIDRPEYTLFLEDDLQFNRHLCHNLERWHPLRATEAGLPFFGSLYNPTIGELERNERQAYFIANPECVYGSQAFLLSLETARYVVDHWSEIAGMQDIKISRLAARLSPVYYHTPSLVQHVGYSSTWGGHYHFTHDFKADWKADLETRN